MEVLELWQVQGPEFNLGTLGEKRRRWGERGGKGRRKRKKKEEGKEERKKKKFGHCSLCNECCPK
jgi:hypothetical protein